MATDRFHDSVIGEVIVRRHQWSVGVSVKYSVRGELVATAPKAVPLAFIKQVVRSKRKEIAAIKQRSDTPHYLTEQSIGKSHRLTVTIDSNSELPAIKTSQRVIDLTIDQLDKVDTPAIQSLIRGEVIKAHRREAKAYLPRRLSLLADRHGYSYSRIRLTHANTRWGSCSSDGTISMNIALMKLPLELIDYVLIHELCHTAQMNHSSSFWKLVEAADPDYRSHRKALKLRSPSL